MKAVVMAGGEGTRLRPLTSNQPKPMVPIVGKPCMEHILELLKQHGMTDVIVTDAPFSRWNSTRRVRSTSQSASPEMTRNVSSSLPAASLTEPAVPSGDSSTE